MTTGDLPPSGQPYREDPDTPLLRRAWPYATPAPRPVPSPWVGVALVALICVTVVAVCWMVTR